MLASREKCLFQCTVAMLARVCVNLGIVLLLSFVCAKNLEILGSQASHEVGEHECLPCGGVLVVKYLLRVFSIGTFSRA